jgi:5,10-methylenetetrahydromethanopterin reductase
MRWGVWFEPVLPVADVADLARRAEAAGADVCFVADEGTDRDLYVTLTAILLRTERIVVAPAVTNPYSRHPVTTAAAVATLAELAPGRVWHGLGVGGSRVLDPLGLTPTRPFTDLRAAVRSSRELLAGRHSGSARLSWTTGSIPMMVAGRGPRVKAFAAAEADWVIMSAEPVATVRAAATRAASGGANVAWSAYLAYTPAERRRVLTHFSYMALDAPPEIRADAGLDDATAARVRDALLAGRMDDAAALLPERLIDHYAVAGEPDACAATIAAHADCVDLFALPMNDASSPARVAEHIDAAAAILGRAVSTHA